MLFFMLPACTIGAGSDNFDTTVSHMLHTMQDPFKRAEIWLRHRKEAKLQDSSILKSLLVSAACSVLLGA